MKKNSLSRGTLGRGTLPNKEHGGYSSEAKAWHLKGWEIQLGRNGRMRRQYHFGESFYFIFETEKLLETDANVFLYFPFVCFAFEPFYFFHVLMREEY